METSSPDSSSDGFSSDIEAIIAEGPSTGNEPDEGSTANASGTTAASTAPAGTAGAASPKDPAASVPPAAVVPPQNTQQPPAAQPPAGQQPGQPPAAAPGDQSASAPSVQQIDWTKHRDTYLPKLQELYKIPDEEVEALRTNPEVALPKLAARLHYEVMTGAFQAVMATLPQAIGLQLETTKLHAANESAFYSANKELKAAVDANPAAEQTIRSAIQSFRHANPKASLQDVVKGAGMLAAMMLGIQVGQQPAAQQQTQQPAPPPPARPAGVGGSTSVMPAAREASGDDVFAEMAERHLLGG